MQKENRSVCGREGKREMAIRGMSEKPRLEWYITSRVARHNGEREREREFYETTITRTPLFAILLGDIALLCHDTYTVIIITFLVASSYVILLHFMNNNHLYNNG